MKEQWRTRARSAPAGPSAAAARPPRQGLGPGAAALGRGYNYWGGAAHAHTRSR